MVISVDWTNIKAFADSRNTSVQWIDLDGLYMLRVLDGGFVLSCTIVKTATPGADQQDFEDNYKAVGNQSSKTQVITQYEVDNKSLKTICIFCVTDSNGVARASIKIPDDSRYVAYGDAEFEERAFGDYISKIEISDIDRLIAWQMALAQDPNATQPVSDATVQANGYPLYPCVGHYDERDITTNSNTAGTILGGMTMNFVGSPSEAQPVGGYAHIPGGMYFVVECTKATAVANKKCQVSIDWAEPA